MTKGKGRPKQPKCPHCAKALYKRMQAGQVKKTDPYAWCRNKKCARYNIAQDPATRFGPLGGVALAPRPKAKPKPAPKPKVPKPTLEWPEMDAETPTGASLASQMWIVDAMKDGPNRTEAHATLVATIRVARQAEANEDAAPDIGGGAMAEAILSATMDATEPSSLAKARARIRTVVERAASQFSPQTVGLALAIVSQETGNHDAANALIAEYGLTERYGIEPRALA